MEAYGAEKIAKLNKLAHVVLIIVVVEFNKCFNDPCLRTSRPNGSISFLFVFVENMNPHSKPPIFEV